MKIVSHDKKTSMVTIAISEGDLLDIYAVFNYLVSTFDEQDSVLLGLPGEQGYKRVSAVQDKIDAVIDELHKIDPKY